MISNTELQFGCIFEPAVHEHRRGVGFVYSHMEIALSHADKGGLNIDIDPDGFVLLEQLRFASLIIRSLPDDVRGLLGAEEKAANNHLMGLANQVAIKLIMRTSPVEPEIKREILNSLKRFDRWSVKRREVIDEHFHKVETVLALQEEYKSRGVIERLYRLQKRHPNQAVREIAAYLVSFPLRLIISGENTLSGLNESLSEMATKKSGDWEGAPANLNPETLSLWIRAHEKSLLG